MMNFYRAPKIAAHARVIAAFAVAAATLGACASSTDLARSNPNYFSADISAGRLTGQYNPSGFSTAEVRDLLAANCTGGQLSGYGETPVDGLVAFTATCKGGTSAHGGSMEFERNGDQVISEGTVYDQNGNLLTPKG